MAGKRYSYKLDFPALLVEGYSLPKCLAAYFHKWPSTVACTLSGLQPMPVLGGSSKTGYPTVEVWPAPLACCPRVPVSPVTSLPPPRVPQLGPLSLYGLEASGLSSGYISAVNLARLSGSGSPPGPATTSFHPYPRYDVTSQWTVSSRAFAAATIPASQHVVSTTRRSPSNTLSEMSRYTPPSCYDYPLTSISRSLYPSNQQSVSHY